MCRLLWAFVLFIAVGSGSAEEVLPPRELPCFPGAYYRKAVSSFDHWTGIEGVLTIPQPVFDESRKRQDGRYLDNPSIYLGGRAEQEEIDAGLTWSRVQATDGKLSSAGQAFRIFWRNHKWHSGPIEDKHCFYPGDRVRMACYVSAPGKLRLEIDLLSRGTNAPIHVREKDRLQNGVLSRFSTEFDARFFSPDKTQQFKRVNAIDQEGREGLGVAETDAKVLNAEWQEVWLRRGTTKLPMTPARYTDMRCPEANHIIVLTDPNRSGETISIFGSQEERRTLNTSNR